MACMYLKLKRGRVGGGRTLAMKENWGSWMELPDYGNCSQSKSFSDCAFFLLYSVVSKDK